MSSVNTTLSLLLLMGIGFLIRGKLKSREQKEGIRVIILSLALPATIFIALVKVNFSIELILIPMLALAFNFIVFYLVKKLPIQTLFSLTDSQYKALLLLIPSLAPGLSCFPFILAYSGEGTVATAALADLGNKVFVLIIAYIIAMRWYLHNNKSTLVSQKINLKDVVASLASEPVNLAIAVAVVMLSFGLSYQSLPDFLRLSIDKISLVMTPLVLLFIGMSIKLTWHQVRTIFSFLFFRAGIAFLVSAIILLVAPINDLATALLVIVFPQSAVSFWPYAHMAAINGLETKSSTTQKTFDLDFGLNVLGCSMPFSVILILIVYNSGSFFAESSNTILISLGFIFISTVPVLLNFLRTDSFEKKLKSKES